MEVADDRVGKWQEKGISGSEDGDLFNAAMILFKMMNREVGMKGRFVRMVLSSATFWWFKSIFSS